MPTPLAAALTRVPWARVMVLLRTAQRLLARYQQLPEKDRRRLRAQAGEVRMRALAVRKAGNRGDAVKELGSAVAELARQLRAA
jgi:hypothetical protein